MNNKKLDLFLKLVLKIKPKIDINYNINLKNMNTFKIKRICSVFIELFDIYEARIIIMLLNEYKIKYFIIGNGSNILLNDNSSCHVFISLKKYMNQTIIDNNNILVQSGIKLSVLANKLLKYSLSGLEFLYGIPGTLGGAIYMNAGAFNNEIKNNIIYVKYLDQNGKLNVIDNKDFEYRYSFFQNQKNFLIVETLMKLNYSNKNFIINNMEKNLSFRKKNHPLNLPNAGSIFKRIYLNDSTIVFPAQLIEKCGLKGFNIGDAQISTKHCGFIVNKGNAKANDIINLIEYIKKIIYKEFGLKLECEINII